jgi:hypothetical protein
MKQTIKTTDKDVSIQLDECTEQPEGTGARKKRAVFYTSEESYNQLSSDLRLKGGSVSEWVNQQIRKYFQEKDQPFKPQ